MTIDIIFLVVLVALMVLAIWYAIRAVRAAHRKKKPHPLDIQPARRKTATAPKG